MPQPHVTLRPATHADQSTLRRLMQLYLYDFSEFENVPLADDGTFGHREFIEEQFSTAHETLLIHADGHLAGFAILSKGSYLNHDPAVTDLTQFFVVRAWRRRGVASSAAHQLFASRPGPWEVRVIDLNTVAQLFWRKTISRFTQGNFAESRSDSTRHKGPVFTFTSNGI